VETQRAIFCYWPSEIVAKYKSLNYVPPGVSKLCFYPSLLPFRARRLPVVTAQKLFSFGYVITRFFFVLYYYLFGLAASPCSVVVRLDNEVTLRSVLSRNVTRVWPLSRSGVGRRLRVATLGIFFF
jgi:hypothetical protein